MASTHTFTRALASGRAVMMKEVEATTTGLAGGDGGRAGARESS